LTESEWNGPIWDYLPKDQAIGKALPEALEALDFMPLYYMTYGEELFIAGGSVCRSFVGHEQLYASDIDIFSSRKNVRLLMSHFTERKYKLVLETPKSFHLQRVYKKEESKFPVRAVNPKINIVKQESCLQNFLDVSTPKQIDICENFDLVNCQMIYTPVGILAKLNAVAAFNNKHLQIKHTDAPLQRVMKYIKTYGLKLDMEHFLTRRYYEDVIDTFQNGVMPSPWHKEGSLY